MGSKTQIEWTDATWTPIRARRRDTGKVGVHCEKVSPACKNCYADRLNRRNLPDHGTGLEFTILNRPKVEMFVDENILIQPLRWKRPRKIFVCSQTDLFGEFVSDEMIDRVFAVMALCQEQHTFQVLTKRPERMEAYLRGSEKMPDLHAPAGARYRIRQQMEMNRFPKWPANGRSYPLFFAKWPLHNVWLGVTAENQEWADKRIPLLLNTPAAKRFVSVEPMLGQVDLNTTPMPPGCTPVNGATAWDLRGCLPKWQTLPMRAKLRDGIDWVIVGGESGPGARPMHPDWVRSIRDQCVAAGVAFFLKQWGEWAPRGPESMGYPVVDGKEVFRLTDAGENGSDLAAKGGRDVWMQRLGKRAAGRLLDGRTWEECPQCR